MLDLGFDLLDGNALPTVQLREALFDGLTEFNLILSVPIYGCIELVRLSAKVRVVSESEGAELGSRVAESPIPCRVKRSLAKWP